MLSNNIVIIDSIINAYKLSPGGGSLEDDCQDHGFHPNKARVRVDDDNRKSLIRMMTSEDHSRSFIVTAPKDEYTAYAELISLKLKKFDLISRLKVQHKIYLEMYSAEMSMLKKLSKEDNRYK